MNWKKAADGMLVEQAGAGTLTVLTIDGSAETWDVGAQDGIGWVKQSDGSLDIFERSTLAVDFHEYDIIGSFAQGGWQCVRWESEDGQQESEGRP